MVYDSDVKGGFSVYIHISSAYVYTNGIRTYSAIQLSGYVTKENLIDGHS